MTAAMPSPRPWISAVSGTAGGIRILIESRSVFTRPITERIASLLGMTVGVRLLEVAALLVIGRQTRKAKVITVSSLYGIAIVANTVAVGILGWRY